MMRFTAEKAWAAAGALLGAAAALLAFAPASWLAAAVHQASQGRVQLAAPRGTVWRGSAQAVLTGGGGSADAAALPGRIEWTLRPQGAGVRLQLQAPCCTAQPVVMQIQPRWGGLRLRVGDSPGQQASQQPTQPSSQEPSQRRSEWPAAWLAGLGTPWNTLRLQGTLILATQGLSVEWSEGRLGVSGRALLVARDLSSPLSTLTPMGSYRITLQGGATPTLQLATLQGPLVLAGSGLLSGGRMRFAGEATAQAGREAALGNLLNIVGRRDGARSIISFGSP